MRKASKPARGQDPRTSAERRVIKKIGPPRMSLLEAAAVVLSGSEEPMTVKAMLDESASKGLWSPGEGKTPAQSLYSAIFREIAVKGEKARFVKAGRGLFTFRRVE